MNTEKIAKHDIVSMIVINENSAGLETELILYILTSVYISLYCSLNISYGTDKKEFDEQSRALVGDHFLYS